MGVGCGRYLRAGLELYTQTRNDWDVHHLGPTTFILHGTAERAEHLPGRKATHLCQARSLQFLYAPGFLEV